MQVETVSNSVFKAGHDKHSLPVLIKRLKATSIKRSRGTFKQNVHHQQDEDAQHFQEGQGRRQAWVPDV